MLVADTNSGLADTSARPLSVPATSATVDGAHSDIALAQHPTDRLDPEPVPIAIYESHYFGGRGSSSRAKKAEAAFNISFARRSSRFSRSNSTIRCRGSTQTFRFGRRILAPSTAFVQRNPEQTRRPLRSGGRGRDNGISVVVQPDATGGVKRAFEHIETLETGQRRSVLVLGRYGFSKESLPPLRPYRMLKVRFSTVHSAKGKEADYVVILDLKDERMGFPCRLEDDPLLDLVLPPLRGQAFPFAEERRLFYIAMTRARMGTYLITDSVRPSIFVTELLDESEDISQLGQLAPKCARCLGGRLIPSLTGKNLRCANFPTCDYLAPRCDSCETGYLLATGRSERPECTGESCSHRATVCPECRIGVLVDRRGRYGPLRGCSRYWADPSCTHTESIAG